MPESKLQKLITLWEARPKSISYDKDEDRLFCNKVFFALNGAWPEIKALKMLSEIHHQEDRCLSRRIDPDYDQAMARLKEPTTQNQAPPSAATDTPSNVPQPELQKEQNTHTQEENPGRVDTLAILGRTEDTGSTPASLPSRLAEARAKAAAAGRAKASKPKSAKSSAAAQPGAPGATA